MLFQQKVATNSNWSIHHDLGRVNTVEDFIQSTFCWIFEVKDQREDELMVDKAKDASSDGLHVLREGIPSIHREPVYFAPINANNPLVLYCTSCDLCRKPYKESNDDDGDIDRYSYHSDHWYLLQQCYLLLEDEDEVDCNCAEDDTDVGHVTFVGSFVPD